MTDPVAIYYGAHTECLFLQTALEGSGVHAFIKNFAVSGPFAEDVRVFVERTDLERALPLVEHFKQHGQKTR
jgi:hypothetical protein